MQHQQPQQNRISIVIDCLMNQWNEVLPPTTTSSSSPQLPSQQQQRKELPLQIQRTVASHIIESVIEYSRIIYDLFYDTTSISVFSSLDQASCINGRDVQEQSLKFMVQSISNINKIINYNIGKPTPNYSSRPFRQYLESAIESLLHQDENTLQSIPFTMNNNIVVLILPFQDDVDLMQFKSENKVYDIAKESQSIIDKLNSQSIKPQGGVTATISDNNHQQQQLTIQKCELIVFKIKSPSNNANRKQQQQQKQETYAYQKVSNQLECFSKDVNILNLFQVLSDLAIHQFNLSSILVTGIPMKESTNSQSQRSVYDVVLLYSNQLLISQRQQGKEKYQSYSNIMDVRNNQHSQQQQQILGSNNLISIPPNQQATGKWKSIDNKKQQSGSVNVETLTFSSTSRVTPLHVTSSPSVCLMKHICGGRPVFLVTLPTEEIYTYVLLLHNNHVYLNTLHSPLDIASIVPILNCYKEGADTNKYRLRDFAKIIDNSILLSGTVAGCPTDTFQAIRLPNQFFVPTQPHTADNQPTIQALSPKIVEKYTRYYPWIENETILFSATEQAEELKHIFEPVKFLLLKDILSPETSDQLRQILSHFFNLAALNEQALFPHVTKANVRKEYYKKLIQELYFFSKTCQTTQLHYDVFQIVERVYCQMTNTQPSPPPTHLLLKQQQQLQQQLQQQQQQQLYQQYHLNPNQAQPLYQNFQQQQQQQQQQLQQGGAGTDAYLDRAKKLAKEDDLRRERDRQMKVTNPKMELAGVGDGSTSSFVQQQESMVEKKRKLDQSPKPNNLFSMYTEKQKKTQAIELDGRLIN